MNAKELPLKVRVASPCPARWEDMGGNDRVRFCDHCRKNVYNLSAMTKAEALSLIEEKKGDLCGRMYQRADGTVLTEDCPVGVARHWRRAKTWAAGCVAMAVFGCVNLWALHRDPANGHRTLNRTRVAAEDAIDTAEGWIGIQRPHPQMLMGKIAPVKYPTTSAPPANNPPPAVPSGIN